MANLQRRILGKMGGNFDPYQTDPRVFLELLTSSICSQPGDPVKVFFPSHKATNRVVLLGMEDAQMTAKCFTSKTWTDGVVIDRPYAAGAIFSADAPVVCIFEPGRPRFALLRGALRCLMPPVDKKGRRDRSIIRVALEDFKFEVAEIKVWVGMGIGPCCYGAEHFPEMGDQSVDIPIGRATRGPRAGKRSIDLYHLIYKQLVVQGVKPTRIDIEADCVCCKGYFLSPRYHSNCRSGPQAGRNAVAFWMT